jgi:hypothetical protein
LWACVQDAILYEGYLLYPYHRSSQKNQVRFQWGVLMPPAYAAVDASESSASQTECILECADDARVVIEVRFLQLQRRTVPEIVPGSGEFRDVDTLIVDGTEFSTWDEAVERQRHVQITVAELLGAARDLEIHIGSGPTSEDLDDCAGRPAGRVTRSWTTIDGVIRLRAERVAGPFGALRLRAGQGRRPCTCADRSPRPHQCSGRDIGWQRRR